MKPLQTLQDKVRLYSLIESFLRQAAVSVKPMTAKQLSSIPEVHRAGGTQREVYNILRTFESKGVLVNFSEDGTKAIDRAYTWKDDMPTPKTRPIMRRTKVERERQAAAAGKVAEPHVVQPVDLFSAMGSGHVLNKPVGQESGYVRREDDHPTPSIGDVSAMVVRLGYQVGMHVNEYNKIVLTITEK